MHGTAYRFTDADEGASVRRMAETVALWKQSSATGEVQTDPTTREALVRVGAAAIGCGIYDLRDSELSWLGIEADKLIGGTK